MSVIVLVLSSVSEDHFFRSFPRSEAALERLSQGRATEVFRFSGYNVVGLDSVTNQVPLFRGEFKEVLDREPKDGGGWIWSYFK